ncbi:putative acyl carrier protein [Parvularcula bermudensis HTCC2503]|uniref:Putative acyl carrier protein n=1 Tax=Parvularcula bermudensis (strain ATCC BAA-594 / HTCC2503 / KCTC 12087) TaxID=314260 RepID=E0TFF4_PARBH|nr:phosphopantetheine-binding protein [Parvularcula bermudensis]ADM09555.1 putative acyl carrier protein [Parvularcula bermudensis HTCC2503]
MNSADIDRAVVGILERFTDDWGVDHQITPDSQIVADLEFESIDVIQLVVAIEQHFGIRNMGFDELLMKDGKYVDDLTVRQIADFINKKINGA